MTPFDAFRHTVIAVAPRAAVVLGSGLADVAKAFHPTATVGYADVPGLVPPTVAGHRGQMSVGHWGGVPAVVCSGRVHVYEGHPWERVTRLVHLLAEFGVTRLLLTNAAGGIRDDLNPGDLMAIRGHLKLLDAGAWATLARNLTPPAPLPSQGSGESESPPSLPGKGDGGLGLSVSPYTLLTPSLPTGVYAALTGPCYETPAEIRALRALGADAVGMSTAVEAEAAAALGLTVSAVSCITNKAAGLAVGTLSHHEVEQTAKAAGERLAAVVADWMAAESAGGS